MVKTRWQLDRAAVIDATLSLAFILLGVLLARRCHSDMQRFRLPLEGARLPQSLWARWSWLYETAVGFRFEVEAFLVVWGIGLALVCLRQTSRPPGRLPGPGRAAVLIGSALALLDIIRSTVWLQTKLGQPYAQGRIQAAVLAVEQDMIYAVLGAWLAIALAGSFGADRHWAEKLGRIWGGCWLAFWFVCRLFVPTWGAA